MATLTLSDAEAAQVLLHTDQAARAAASGDSHLAGVEALLVWAMLTANGAPVSDRGTIVEVTPLGRIGDEQIRQVERRALEAAYALIGHFVGEQRFDLVRLYEAAVGVLSQLLGEPGSARDTPHCVPPRPARVVVTCREVFASRRTRSILRHVIPDGRLRFSPFRGVLEVKSTDDPMDLAQRITRDCAPVVGRVTAILEEVPSEAEPVRHAALQIATRQIGASESFAFRLHKRGDHG